MQRTTSLRLPRLAGRGVDVQTCFTRRLLIRSRIPHSHRHDVAARVQFSTDLAQVLQPEFTRCCGNVIEAQIDLVVLPAEQLPDP